MEAYQQVLETFFYFAPQNAEAVFNDTHVKPAYMQVAEEKSKEELTQWKGFLQDMQGLENIQRIRDWSHSSMHAQKVLITLDTKASSGICLFLSYLGNYIGIYYIDELNTWDRPVFGHEVGQMSYQPMNDGHIIMTDHLLKLVDKHFPGFVLFDNKNAGIMIEQLQRFEAFYPEIPLFHAIFETMLTGLI